MWEDLVLRLYFGSFYWSIAFHAGGAPFAGPILNLLKEKFGTNNNSFYIVFLCERHV